MTTGSYDVRADESTDGTPVFIARDPDLPGCMAHGATPGEAIENLAEARELYLSAGPIVRSVSTERVVNGDVIVAVRDGATQSAGSLIDSATVSAPMMRDAEDLALSR
jgi:predicted RNase H-like HicB family nuclease